MDKDVFGVVEVKRKGLYCIKGKEVNGKGNELKKMEWHWIADLLNS